MAIRKTEEEKQAERQAMERARPNYAGTMTRLDSGGLNDCKQVTSASGKAFMLP